jgi:NhaP-type Na+/H+ or K+/H+ antiporter
MLAYFPFYLALIVAIVLLVMLANKLKIAYPILLVLGGLVAGFIPGMPKISVDPELIFVIFLPPLLYGRFPGRSSGDGGASSAALLSLLFF